VAAVGFQTQRLDGLLQFLVHDDWFTFTAQFKPRDRCWKANGWFGSVLIWFFVFENLEEYNYGNDHHYCHHQQNQFSNRWIFGCIIMVNCRVCVHFLPNLNLNPAAFQLFCFRGEFGVCEESNLMQQCMYSLSMDGRIPKVRMTRANDLWPYWKFHQWFPQKLRCGFQLWKMRKE
jgi:hypothetical protein